MSSRKLVIVECSKQQINPDDDEDYRFVICFVEERWLKRKDEDWVVAVMDEPSAEKANKMLEEYVSSQSFRLTEEDARRVVIDRMLNAAIAIKYLQKDVRNLTAAEYEKQRRAQEEARQRGNPLSTIDTAEPAMEEAIRTLCHLLGIVHHPDPAVSLQAACLFITKNLSKGAIEQAKQETEHTRLALNSSFPLGIAKNKEPAVNTAARILRLLCLEELKEKQALVNQTLVHVQDLIAEIGGKK